MFIQLEFSFLCDFAFQKVMFHHHMKFSFIHFLQITILDQFKWLSTIELWMWCTLLVEMQETQHCQKIDYITQNLTVKSVVRCSTQFFVTAHVGYLGNTVHCYSYCLQFSILLLGKRQIAVSCYSTVPTVNTKIILILQ